MPRQHYQHNNSYQSNQYTSSRYNSNGGGSRYPSKYSTAQRPLGAEEGVLPLNRPVIPIDKLIKHAPAKQGGQSGNSSQMSGGLATGAHKQVSPSGTVSMGISNVVAAVTSSLPTAEKVVLAPMSAQHASSTAPVPVTSNVGVVSPSTRRSLNTTAAGSSAAHVLKDEQKRYIRRVNQAFI